MYEYYNTSIQHIYIHIPFCEKKCAYCDFNIFIGKKKWFDRYFQALLNEISITLDSEDLFLKNNNITLSPLKSIYIGGGTPSFVSVDYIKKIIDLIKSKREIDKNAEITIEVNPGDVNYTKLISYLSLGINRLSIGIQSINDHILKDIGRSHNHQLTTTLIENVMKLPFKSYSIDLMVGLPKQSLTDIKETIEWVKKINPPHISAYSLILEENTHFWFRFGPKGREKLPSVELERELWHTLRDGIKDLGYLHYEISNFAQTNYKSIHNSAYWEGKLYHGFGAGASRYLWGYRSTNIRRLKDYCDFYSSDFSKTFIENFSLLNFNKIESFVDIEEINFKKAQAEFFILGLRFLTGISEKMYMNFFNSKMPFLYRKKLEDLHHKNLLRVLNEKDSWEEWRYALSFQGEDLANQVFSYFLD